MLLRATESLNFIKLFAETILDPKIFDREIATGVNFSLLREAQGVLSAGNFGQSRLGPILTGSEGYAFE